MQGFRPEEVEQHGDGRARPAVFDDMDVVADFPQWRQVAPLVGVGDERDEGNLVVGGQAFQEMVSAQPVAAVGRVGEAGG